LNSGFLSFESLRDGDTQDAPRVSHPISSGFVARFMTDIEDKGNAEYRRENLAGVKGRVIELGVGTGLNFAHYGRR
jgi:hypothetical protein